ncbi:MAG: putative multidrug export ATP-binding/permease protein [Chlamydiae bacterium]|nr:putative multidrug export ATP-binding/permease protein [Chlamydiota bacterium]
MNAIHSSPLKFIFYFVKKQWISFLFLLIFCGFWSFKEVMFPYFTRNIINALSANSQGDLTGAYLPAFYLILTWVCMEIACRLLAQVKKIVFPQFRANVRKYCFNYIKDHSYQFFTENLTGKLASHVSNVPKSCEKVAELIFINIASVGGACIIGLFLFGIVSVAYSLIALLWIISYFLTLFYFLNQLQQAEAQHSESVSTLDGRISDTIANMLTVKIFSREDLEMDYLRNFQNKEINESKKAINTMEKMKKWHSLQSVIFLSSILSSLFFGWKNSFVTIGDFMLVPMLTFSMLGMIWWLGDQMNLLFREIGVIQSTLNLFNLSTSAKEAINSKKLHLSKGSISFCNVGFSYEPEKEVFSNLNLSIKGKEKVGLVGHSGAGKSTLVSLLLRLYDVRQGTILMDGQDISKVSLKSLRSLISFIPQDFTLLHRTIKENISYGNPNATDADIITSAKRAHCHDFILQLESGYETVVGERGWQLSAGQRQRISIARAFLKGAPILILDEATSALDFETEKCIRRSLSELMKERTVIVIAHRYSTLSELDRIIVLKNGKIIRSGLPDTLFDNENYLI